MKKTQKPRMITKSEVYGIREFLTGDRVLKHYIYDDVWISGSSTKVYPISVDRRGFEIQLWNNRQWKKCWKEHHGNMRASKLHARLFEGVFNRLFKSRYGKLFDRRMCGFSKSDGSCPDYLHLHFKGAYDEGVVFDGNGNCCGWDFMYRYE